MVMDQDAMESLPAPDMVGREFVRQYYTLLNEAPEHAHRFYNSNSYFVHGTMTKPAIGQVEIHRKIQQLNFRDCHAKISQVDSQVTLGNGVVVQVSGELSNDGEPMRRFSQTFVLGTQSPKKYYVHNDIFRYQDMLQSDEEVDATPEKEESVTEIPQEAPAHDYYPQPAPVVESPPQIITAPAQPLQVAAPVNAVPHVNVNGAAGIHIEDQRGPEVVKPVHEPPAAPVVNGGTMIPEELPRIIPPTNVPEPAPAVISRQGPGHLLPDETIQKTEGGIVISPKSDYEEEILSDLPDGNEQKTTFANLVKNGRGDRGSGPRGFPRNAPGGHNMHIGSHGPPPPTGGDHLSENVHPPTSNTTGPAQRGPVSGGIGGSRGHPDSHQLFLGSLPPEATDEKLRALFSNYGKVIDLKIQNSTKATGVNRFYGFVTFEDATSATQCLNSKPIYFQSESGARSELNVEPKNTHRNSIRSNDGRGGTGAWPMGRGQSGRGRGSQRGALRGSYTRGTPVSSRSFPRR